jgi:mannose-1-phosphate guanylyltransferase
MRAMILAAGLGTRLLPLTNSRPKALFPLRGVTMLDFWIERLNQFGFDAVFLNAYHLKDHICRAISKKDWPLPVRVIEEPVLLGTGGGIKGAVEHFEDDPAVVINVDIVSDANLSELLCQHKDSGAKVSLLLHDWPEFNNVAVDEAGYILGFGREAEAIRQSGNGVRLLAFTGVHFINASALADSARGVPGDILTVYRRLIAGGAPPRALYQEGLFWREMGSIGSYWKLTMELADLKSGCLRPLPTGQSISIHPEAVVQPGSNLRGSIVAGPGVRIESGASLNNVILWDGVRVEKDSCLKDCIVADGMSVAGRHAGKIFAPDLT